MASSPMAVSSAISQLSHRVGIARAVECMMHAWATECAFATGRGIFTAIAVQIIRGTTPRVLWFAPGQVSFVLIVWLVVSVWTLSLIVRSYATAKGDEAGIKLCESPDNQACCLLTPNVQENCCSNDSFSFQYHVSHLEAIIGTDGTNLIAVGPTEDYASNSTLTVTPDLSQMTIGPHALKPTSTTRLDGGDKASSTSQSASEISGQGNQKTRSEALTLGVQLGISLALIMLVSGVFNRLLFRKLKAKRDKVEADRQAQATTKPNRLSQAGTETTNAHNIPQHHRTWQVELPNDTIWMESASTSNRRTRAEMPTNEYREELPNNLRLPELPGHRYPKPPWSQN